MHALLALSLLLFQVDGGTPPNEGRQARINRYRASIPLWAKNVDVLEAALGVQYCRAKNARDKARTEIEKEQKIGAVAGLVNKAVLYKASRKVVESQEVMDHAIKLITRGSTEHPKEMDALCTEAAPEYAGLQLALKCAPEGGGDYALPFRDKACDGEETHAILIMAEQSY